MAQSIFNGYSKAFNARYAHTGTLFEGPYAVIRVDTDTHLLHLCRYIHANPVKDGFAIAPERWPYSNYLDWIGQRKGTLLDRQFVGQHFPEPGRYATFVQDYLTWRQADAEMEHYAYAIGEFIGGCVALQRTDRLTAWNAA